MVVCVFAVLLAIAESYSSYANLDKARAYMQSNAASFRAAGDFVMNFRDGHNRFPTEAELTRWAHQRGDGEWAKRLSGDPVLGSSLACTNAQPEDGFKLPASDIYILHKWRGEWFDCYGLPSGANNVVHDLPGDDIHYHLALWTFAAVMMLIGWWFNPIARRRRGA